MIVVGLVGLIAARTLVRLVISAEIVTLGLLVAVLGLAPVELLVPAAILLVVVGGAEVVAAVAVMYRLYGEAKTSDVEVLKAGRENA